MKGEKKINERINTVEEMIRRAHKMEDLGLPITLTFP